MRGKPPAEQRTPLYRVVAGAVADTEGREWKVKGEARETEKADQNPPFLTTL
jgi:hypothetical protein